MRHAVLLVVTILIVAGCQSSSGSSASSSSGGGGGDAVRASAGAADATQAIRKLLDEYTAALLKQDYAALERIWSDDLTFVNPRGELVNKSQRLANLRSGATAFKTIDTSETSVRAYGDNAAAAVAVTRVKVDGHYSGQEGSGTYRVTTVWARPRGPWQMVAVHMTRIEQ